MIRCCIDNLVIILSSIHFPYSSFIVSFNFFCHSVVFLIHFQFILPFNTIHSYPLQLSAFIRGEKGKCYILIRN